MEDAGAAGTQSPKRRRVGTATGGVPGGGVVVDPFAFCAGEDRDGDAHLQLSAEQQRIVVSARHTCWP